jgi:hypothetical protein
MKALMLVAAFIWPAIGAMGQVIITQYYEGASNDKYIEITNIGASSVDLSTYYLGRWSNTETPTGTAANYSQLSGTIAAGETQVYMNSSAVNPPYAVTNSVGTTTATYFNGDDPVAITNGSADWADAVDVIYAAGTWGGERSFVRKSTVTTGNTGQSVLDGSGEWVEYTLTQVADATSSSAEYLGYHDDGAIAGEPTNHVTSFAATADDASSITLTWVDNDGAQAAEAFLLKASTGAITPPVDGTEEADDTDLSDGAAVVSVAHGTETYTFTGLPASNAYNFEIYPYTNTGTDINFKTDGTVPTASATTMAGGTLGWYNLQWPESGTITLGGEYIVYAQAWENGVTTTVGAGAGIQAWIGYSTENTDPSTWTNWVDAPYSGDAGDGNNDEFSVDLGAVLPVGQYYYASRFQFNGGEYMYGGFQGGAWDGTNNVSGVLTIKNAPITTPFSETFDTDLGNMYTYSVSGATKEWGHDGTDQAASMNGFNSGDLEEDWMIFPSIDLSAKANEELTFDTWYKYGTDDVDNYLKLMYSEDYTGVGDPSSATWTELTFAAPAAAETWTTSGAVDLAAINGVEVYIAFKYHYNSGSYRTWKIDNIAIDEAAVGEVPAIANVVTTPMYPTSSDAINVSADVTDADGTIATVTLNWGTTSGSLGTPINMTVGTGDNYVVDTDIPAQADGTVIYYEIVAEDNDGNLTNTSEMMIEVSDPATATLPYTNDFAADLGDMYLYDAQGAQGWFWDEYGGSQYAKISGFSGGAQDNVDWMITPSIDFSGVTAIQMSFDEIINYGGVIDDEQEVFVSTDYTGTGDPASATWVELAITNRPPGTTWDWYSVDIVDLSAYAGETSVHIAFKYTSTTGGAATWEVDNLVIEETPAGAAPVIENIAVNPVAPTSSDAISISADVTDTDGTISTVTLNWGTASGTLGNAINMSVGTGDNYVVDTDIPAQTNGTTVYYQIVAVDNDNDETTTSEMSVTVIDAATATIPYTNTFDTDLGDMYTFSVTGAQVWGQDEYSGKTYAKMSGFSGSAQENEDWMITPGFDFSALTQIEMHFEEAINYGGTIADEQEVFISTDYIGTGDPSAATWTELTVTGRASGSSWDFVTVNPINLSAYAGETSVHIGFKYTSTTGGAATWEVDSVVVKEGATPQSPIIENIVTPQSVTSSDAVSISADVTDADGTITSVTLNWGTASGTLDNAINMSLSTGDTYVTDTDIPAQADGTIVYYEIVAVDNDAQETVTSEMMYNVSDPVTATLPYSEDFTDNTFGDLTVYSVTGDQVWEVASYGNPSPGAKVTGYAGGNFANEDWMITPGLDFSGVTEAKLVFDEAINYANVINDEQEILVSTDYAGTGDPSSATWTELTVTGRSPGNSWSFVTVNDVDLSAYAGESLVYIAFKYTSTTSYGATWEVDNILVEEGAAVIAPVIENLALTPAQPSSTETVSVSATITDGDGTITSATLHWGTTVFYGNTINMSVSSGDTYVTDTDIPAQAVNTLIFYKIVAVDNDANQVETDPMAYAVYEPFTGTFPFFEPFHYDLGVMSEESVVGDNQSWNWDDYGYALMSGYAGGAVANEDWLVTPMLDLSGNYQNVTLSFEEAINYGGTIDDEQEVYVSTDYSGDASTATWTKLTVTGRAAGDSWTFVTVDPVSLNDYIGEASVYIGFKYTSDATNAATWEVDDISIEVEEVGIANANVKDLTIYPNPAQNEVFVTGVENITNVQVLSLDGKVVMSEQTNNNRIDVSSMNDGMYIIRVISGNEVYTTRFVKE